MHVLHVQNAQAVWEQITQSEREGFFGVEPVAASWHEHRCLM